MKVLQINDRISAEFSIPAGTDVVQFCRALSREEYAILGASLRGRPEVKLRVYDSGRTEFTDLEFLSYFPHARRLSIELFWLTNIDGFQAINDLEELVFGWTKKKTYSLRSFGRFGGLRTLYVEGHKRDIEVVGTLSGLERLTLRSITIPDIGFLADLPRLHDLEIKLGGTRNLRALSTLANLRYLELWLIKGLSDVSAIGQIESLESLVLQALRNVTELPSFRNLPRLRSVHLQAMKGLTDLRPVADAPALEALSLIDMSSIDPKKLRCFVGHAKLREFRAGLGSFKRNAYAEALVGLPPRVWLPPGAREKATLDVMADAMSRAVN